MIQDRTLEVEIPPGIHDGQRIRLGGEGHAGTPGGRAGDAYVEVHVRHHDRFVREGNDVYTTVDLTITQAALGATVQVPTLEGETEVDVRARHAAGRSAGPPRPRACPCCRDSGEAASACS